MTKHQQNLWFGLDCLSIGHVRPHLGSPWVSVKEGVIQGFFHWLWWNEQIQLKHGHFNRQNNANFMKNLKSTDSSVNSSNQLIAVKESTCYTTICIMVSLCLFNLILMDSRVLWLSGTLHLLLTTWNHIVAFYLIALNAAGFFECIIKPIKGKANWLSMKINANG